MPFTAQDFFNVFDHYNRAVYPLQFVLILAALIAIYYSARPALGSGKLVSAVLALLWLWAGVVYQFLFFSPINTLAYLFGVLFVVQAAIFFYAGVWRGKLTFSFTSHRYGITGWILVLY